MHETADGAELLGGAAFMVVVVVALAVLLLRGLRSGSRRHCLTNVGLVCGLAMWIVPELPISRTSFWSAGLLAAFGVARIAIGCAGVGLGLLALRTPEVRADVDGSGTAAWKPTTAVVLGGFHAIAGVALIMYSSLTAPSKPWVYADPTRGFRLTLPSRAWRQVPAGSGPQAPVVAFRLSMPAMQACVSTVRQGQTEEGFFRAVAESAALLRTSARAPANVSKLDGINGAGHRYQYTVLETSTPGGARIIVGHSVTWIERTKTVVEVMFEGLPVMWSQIGRTQEIEGMDLASRSICTSVE